MLLVIRYVSSLSHPANEYPYYADEIRAGFYVGFIVPKAVLLGIPSTTL